jgi:hypothetical protein
VKRLGVALVALVAGCATLSEPQCRGTDWYRRGEQDGLLGLRPQIDQYAHQCARFNVQPSEKDYMSGWSTGYSEWSKKVSGARG